jgi:hypothetical protein
MKVSLFEIYSSVGVLNKLVDLALPAKSSYKFVKIMKKFNDELKMLEDERQKLINKYGEEKDGVVSVLEKHKEDFLKEFSELLETQIDVDWDPISIDSLGNVELSVSEITKIQFLFRD